MGCGIARFGWSCLNATSTWKFGLNVCPPGTSRGAAPRTSRVAAPWTARGAAKSNCDNWKVHSLSLQTIFLQIVLSEFFFQMSLQTIIWQTIQQVNLDNWFRNIVKKIPDNIYVKIIKLSPQKTCGLILRCSRLSYNMHFPPQMCPKQEKKKII